MGSGAKGGSMKGGREKPVKGAVMVSNRKAKRFGQLTRSARRDNVAPTIEKLQMLRQIRTNRT